ncbi:MAG: AraC family transcriptional regulator [Porcipelethomonas sp.]
MLYVQEAGMLPHERAGKTKLKKIDSFLIILVLSGEGVIEYEGLEYTVHERQCVFIDCHKEHLYRSNPENPWELMWLHFNGGHAEYFFNEFIKRNRFIFNPSSFEALENIFHEIILVNSSSSEQNEILNNKYITDILTHFITEYNVPETESSASCKTNPVKKYIDMHFTEDISLDELSERFYISKYYLIKEFKKNYGLTIFQYITEKRMGLAKQLLERTDKTVDEISVRCGFHDQSYFARQFKKHEGMTCLSYRKNITVSGGENEDLSCKKDSVYEKSEAAV